MHQDRHRPGLPTPALTAAHRAAPAYPAAAAAAATHGQPTPTAQAVLCKRHDRELKRNGRRL
jgi:hypothetical protein